jgi:hypothetical protein
MGPRSLSVTTKTYLKIKLDIPSEIVNVSLYFLHYVRQSSTGINIFINTLGKPLILLNVIQIFIDYTFINQIKCSKTISIHICYLSLKLPTYVRFNGLLVRFHKT